MAFDGVAPGGGAEKLEASEGPWAPGGEPRDVFTGGKILKAWIQPRGLIKKRSFRKKGWWPREGRDPSVLFSESRLSLFPPLPFRRQLSF